MKTYNYVKLRDPVGYTDKELEEIGSAARMLWSREQVEIFGSNMTEHIRRDVVRWVLNAAEDLAKTKVEKPNPSGSFDAEEWARAWMTIKIDNPALGSEFGEMVAWFANALVSGYDHGYAAAKRVFVPVLDAIIHELGVPQPGYPQPVVNAYEIAFDELRRIDPLNVLVAPDAGGEAK